MNGVWGKKIGMTQIFSEEGRLLPVTVIESSDWMVVGRKSEDSCGYNAYSVGRLRSKYAGEKFSPDWLKKLKNFFSVIREVRFSAADDVAGDVKKLLEVGDLVDFSQVLSRGVKVDVFGISSGKGFQGVVKRHGFSGGRASHGDTLGRRPGSLSCFREQGRVAKGKAMPGHMGFRKCSVRNLEVLVLEPGKGVFFVNGSIPGRSGSLVFVRRQS